MTSMRTKGYQCSMTGTVTSVGHKHSWARPEMDKVVAVGPHFRGTRLTDRAVIRSLTLAKRNKITDYEINRLVVFNEVAKVRDQAKNMPLCKYVYI